VICFWQDAKFGTIANVIILAVAVVALGGFQFNRKVSQEINQMFSSTTVQETPVITSEDLSRLPQPVQKWLTSSGIVGKTKIQAVRLKQKALIKMKPKQEKWNPAYAEQYFTTAQPAFIWKVDMKMMPLIKVEGRDKFSGGQAEMLMNILGLIPVVNQGSNEKINSGALQRYLAEIVWFPSDALSPYITWEKMDDHSAKATLTYKGTTGSGTFIFDEKGNFTKFSAPRYMGGDEDAELKEWVITAQETQVISGIRIPVKLEVTWKLGTGEWTWLKIDIMDIQYNLTDEYQ
jgi:hypothetical protein